MFPTPFISPRTSDFHSAWILIWVRTIVTGALDQLRFTRIESFTVLIKSIVKANLFLHHALGAKSVVSVLLMSEILSTLTTCTLIRNKIMSRAKNNNIISWIQCCKEQKYQDTVVLQHLLNTNFRVFFFFYTKANVNWNAINSYMM